VNLHEISAYDYLQAPGPDRPTETEYHAVDTGRVGETAHSSHDDDEGILANLTKSGRAKPRDRNLPFNADTHLKPSALKLPPGDISRVLSSSLAKQERS
jgi:hypothetical protein